MAQLRARKENMVEVLLVAEIERKECYGTGAFGFLYILPDFTKCEVIGKDSVIPARCRDLDAR